MDIFGLFDLPLWVALSVGIIFLFHKYYTYHANTWIDQGIPAIEQPSILAMYRFFRSGISLFEIDKFLPKVCGKFVGSFELRKPCLLISDTAMIKQILLKDFPNFTERMMVGPPMYPTKDMVTTAEGDHWRHLRKIMSPTFSTGKLKQMMQHMNRCAANLVKHMRKTTAGNDTLDCKEFTGAFSMDVIAGTAFGIHLDSQLDRNNPMVVNAGNVFRVNFKSPFIWIVLLFPFTLKYMEKFFNLSLIPPQVTEFFRSVVNQAIAGREENTEMKQLDFLQLMVNAEKLGGDEDVSHLEATPENNPVQSESGTAKDVSVTGMTHDEVTANGMVFITAGYETIATTMSFMMYLLAVNPEKQDMLYEEINNVIGNKETIDYETLGQLPYLTMCIEETLRMYAPGTRINRMCAKDTQVGDYLVKAGTYIVISMNSLHYNEDLWPEPEIFTPERFSAEEKANRDPMSWLPFGAGPRNCIGLRMALLEIQVAMAMVVQNFRLRCCDATQVPLKFPLFTQILAPTEPIRLLLEPRTTS